VRTGGGRGKGDTFLTSAARGQESVLDAEAYPWALALAAELVIRKDEADRRTAP